MDSACSNIATILQHTYHPRFNYWNFLWELFKVHFPTKIRGRSSWAFHISLWSLPSIFLPYIISFHIFLNLEWTYIPPLTSLQTSLQTSLLTSWEFSELPPVNLGCFRAFDQGFKDAHMDSMRSNNIVVWQQTYLPKFRAKLHCGKLSR